MVTFIWIWKGFIELKLTHISMEIWCGCVLYILCNANSSCAEWIGRSAWYGYYQLYMVMSYALLSSSNITHTHVFVCKLNLRLYPILPLSGNNTLFPIVVLFSLSHCAVVRWLVRTSFVGLTTILQCSLYDVICNVSRFNQFFVVFFSI